MRLKNNRGLVGYYGTCCVFVIVQVRCCPALMVPVAVDDEPTCVQSPEKVVVKPGRTILVSVTENAPVPNVTRVPLTLAGNVDGVGLLPVTVILKSDITGHCGSTHTSTFLTNKVPVVGVGIGVTTPSCEQVAFSPG